MNKENKLSLLLNKFFSNLESNKIEYCVIGNYDQLPEYTENDVDFWVDNISRSEEILFTIAKDVGLNLYMVNKTAVGSNNYFYCFENDSMTIVKIDLMSETAFKSLFTIVTSDQIKDNRERYKNFYIANAEIEGVMHLLYPLLNQGVSKDKYKRKLELLINNAVFYKAVEQSIGAKLSKQLSNYIIKSDWDNVDALSKKLKRQIIRQTFYNFKLAQFVKYGKYAFSLFNKLITKNGIVICFTGIDGAGKTSIKQHLIDNSDKFFAKNRKAEFYWRPFLIPRIATLLGASGQKEKYDEAGKRKINKNPRFFIKSYVKYFLYIFDFIVGQIKYYKALHTGGVVVFDRYHFDNIIYPERFGFTVNKNIMRFFDKYIVPQPDILFYFSADTKTLFERKHEIDEVEIDKQKSFYEQEMRYNKSVVLIKTDGSFDSTFIEVLQHCFEKMNLRYKNK